MPPALIDIFTPVFFGLINELRPSNQQNTKQKNEESTFSNFSCMFLDPNYFFQFEF